MVKARTWFTLFIVSFGTLGATVSCGSDEATGGSGGASGGGIISAGGRAGAVGRAGSGNGSTSSPIGSTCTTDAQCGAGLKCATVGNELLGAKSGPAHGLCTMECTVGSTTECDAVEAGAACLNFGTDTAPVGYCLEACVRGGSAADSLNKCSGRSDVACVDLGTESVSAPFCVPNCISDADCGAGLFCDKSSVLGLCTKTKPQAGDPTGTPCDPEAVTTTCQAFCLRTSATGVVPVTGTCAEFCSVGTECQYSGAKPGGLCAGLFDVNDGPGDLGYCEPNCSCSSDCGIAGDLCRKWTADESQLATALGAEGLCYPVLLDSVELTCGEGGAGGAGGGGGAGAAGDGAGGTAGAEPAAAGSSGSGL